MTKTSTVQIVWPGASPIEWKRSPEIAKRRLIYAAEFRELRRTAEGREVARRRFALKREAVWDVLYGRPIGAA